MKKSTLLTTFHQFDFTPYRLPMIVVYDTPSDFPNHIVARLFDINEPTEYAVIAENVPSIRQKIPLQHKLKRAEHDDPNIVEMWL